MSTLPKKIAIACQGGGSLSAYTAGVLKKMLTNLDQRRYNIIGLSGTSGGAICALMAWYGVLIDDKEKGAQILQKFWDENAATKPFDAWFNSFFVFASWFAETESLPQVSPYDVPEIGKGRLRQLLEKHVPFDALPELVKNTSPVLYIGAVNVANGKFEAFTGRSITVDKILASAAIPSMFRAVQIKDGADAGIYWDGLFSQNPPLRNFLQPESVVEKPDEIWVIRLDPQITPLEPKTLLEIEVRRNLLTGNLSLNQELFFLQKVNEWVRKGSLPPGKFKHIQVREIALKDDLDITSKVNRDPTYIHSLVAQGESDAEQFIKQLK
jgi:NTE family protein